MKQVVSFLLLGWLSSIGLWAQNTLHFGLRYAPFPDPGRAEGHGYKNTFFPEETHYQDSTVLVYIPRHFQPGAAVDFVVHFHGWWNDVDSACNHFELAKQMESAGVNALLLLPQGPRRAADSYGGKLEKPLGFQRLMAELMDSLKTRDLIPVFAKIGSVTLSGHSGGYRVMAFILEGGGMEKHINEAWVFDGLYAEEQKYLDWLQRNPGHRLVNIYTDDGGTRESSLNFLSQLRERGIPYLTGPETAIKDGELAQNRIVFLHSDLGHNEVLHGRKQFERLLNNRWK